MGDDLDVCSCNVGVGFDEMCAEDAGKQFRRGDGVFFRLDVYRVLHGVGGNYHAIVGSGIPAYR